MSSAGTRERHLPLRASLPSYIGITPYGDLPLVETILADGAQKTVSESHPINRKTGRYDAGGPFYTSKIEPFSKPGSVKDAYSGPKTVFYSGPVHCPLPSSTEMSNLGISKLQFGDKNESQMKVKGTNAISYSSPINPASNLGTGLAETMREGIPSLPGIQAWKRRTEILKGLGSEYLNYQFGWAPLANEVHEVSRAARHHRDIMKQYQDGEGRNTHRRFDYPSESSFKSGTIGTGRHIGFDSFSWYDLTYPLPSRQVSLVKETKAWFEGLYTYALPSSTDSWRSALGFGSQADQIFGIALTPDILWELTPWSWAVDWFSNAGEVINNCTNFGLAGLVLRYGFMMEETTTTITAELSSGAFQRRERKPLFPEKYGTTFSGPSSSGYKLVTKCRVPASPFGFSVGWEGLSPTQLAITAALGITRLL
jgi:hypothetical protein